MPFPSDTCSPDELPAGCGLTLYGQGLALLQAALDGLECCLVPDGPCSCDLAAYVSMGPVGVPDGDVLVVSLDGAGIELSPGSVRSNGLSPSAGPPAMRSVWRLWLQETGYPGPQDTLETMILPGPAELAAANRWAYAHGEAMYRGVIGALSTRKIPGCSGYFISDLTIVPPSQGLDSQVAGWTMGVKLDLSL